MLWLTQNWKTQVTGYVLYWVIYKFISFVEYLKELVNRKLGKKEKVFFKLKLITALTSNKDLWGKKTHKNLSRKYSKRSHWKISSSFAYTELWLGKALWDRSYCSHLYSFIISTLESLCSLLTHMSKEFATADRWQLGILQWDAYLDKIS